MTTIGADELLEPCPRCGAHMEWRHATFQCPRCRFKVGCCEGETAECRTAVPGDPARAASAR